MLPQRLAAALLFFSLLTPILGRILYWATYAREEKRGDDRQRIGYNRLFLSLVAVGYFGIWPCWVGAMVFLFLDRYYATFDFLIFSFPKELFVQIAGLTILYAGSLFFTWAIGFAGKSLRPSTSGVHANHRLVQDGPLGIVRHPYYVSYVLMLVGLALTLTTLWPVLFALCVVIGMGPTARAEEEQLRTLFGEEYQQYQEKVGRFFPKLFK